MADIYTIPDDASIDTVWTELTFSDARMLKDPNAADQAPTFDVLVARTEGVRNNQYAVWRGELVAEAGVAAANDDLDDVVNAVDEALLVVLSGKVQEKRKNPRYRRYFKKPRNEVVKLGLESELGQVEGWPDSLKSEPEPSLQEVGGRLEVLVTNGTEAVKDRKRAKGATADQRVREIITLIRDVNSARRASFGVLVQRAEALGLRPDWPHRFFRRSTFKPAAPTSPTTPPA